MAGSLTEPLALARVQDAAAWLTLAVALALAPWGTLWDTVDVERPDPAGPFVAGGVALAIVAVAHGAGRIAGGGPRSVVCALALDVAGAAALLALLLGGDPPTTGTLGTVVLAVTAAGLALQALFDGAMLRQHAA